MELEIKDESPENSRQSVTKYIPKEDRLKGCCGVTDKRVLQLSAKFFISLLVLGVSFFSLLTNDQCDGSNNFWVSMVSTIVSVYITDKAKKEEKKNEFI
jgi:hypothetical protein